MKPFDQYPEDGLKLLPKARGDNARHGYVLELQRLTKQTSCAYCGVSLVDDYYRWLLLSRDHVIPVGEASRLGMRADWRESYSNMLLCCLGCNAFDNKYTIPWDETASDWTVERFFQLRDRVFEERKRRILHRRAEEIQFFEGQPWSA